MFKVIAIIPARSGSKSIKNKNLQKIEGKTLLQKAIEFSNSIDEIDRTFVTTDTKKYQNLALKYGAECPFLRPKILAGDSSLDIDVFYHCLMWIKQNYNFMPEIIINLRPTYPFRKKKDFKYAIRKIRNNKNIDSIKSICKIPFPIDKTWLINKKNFLVNSIDKKNLKEFWNYPRQKLKTYYVQNGNIDITRSKLILKNKMSGKKIFPMVQDHFFDIDSLSDIKNFRKFKNL